MGGNDIMKRNLSKIDCPRQLLNMVPPPRFWLDPDHARGRLLSMVDPPPPYVSNISDHMVHDHPDHYSNGGGDDHVNPIKRRGDRALLLGAQQREGDNYEFMRAIFTISFIY